MKFLFTIAALAALTLTGCSGLLGPHPRVSSARTAVGGSYDPETGAVEGQVSETLTFSPK